MSISSLIDKLNAEMDRLNKLKDNNYVDTTSFFTDNEHFNDTVSPEELLKKDEDNNDLENKENINSSNIVISYPDIEPDDKTKSLIEVKPNYLLTAQTMFKKSIKFSIKAFLISLSLSFLNLFI